MNIAAAPAQYECSIQGAFNDDQLLAPVLERLRGLCSSEAPIHYREMVYKPPTIPGSPPPTSSSSEVMRARCHFPENKWTLRNYNAMSNDKRSATVKNLVEIDVSNNVCSFLEFMGYKHDFEFFMRGHKFTAQRSLTITVTQVKKSDKGHAEPTETFGKVWLVDISCIAADDMLQQACDLLQSFAEHLLPYVDVAKIERTLIDKPIQPMAPTAANFANFNNPTSPRVAYPPPASERTKTGKKDGKGRLKRV